MCGEERGCAGDAGGAGGGDVVGAAAVVLHGHHPHHTYPPCIAPSGPAGASLTHQLPYFVSGVGYPDWTVLGAEMLEDGQRGIRGAGYFGADWTLESGEAAWR